ncbi:hypothetical protein AXG93_4202s1010 [Marchantia polymorpha subsp. ruderalis]|uniref:Uncharacterized protein n=1 Tax=Marchantia polymorpha subsp. ruderalis TaxID=1480154 RepID=A0A176WG98_MARPO|nr:hypothetical protein AXG93_4202s1010 [Marchantia polymorpha subsp. ruderalis]
MCWSYHRGWLFPDPRCRICATCRRSWQSHELSASRISIWSQPSRIATAQTVLEVEAEEVQVEVGGLEEEVKDLEEEDLAEVADLGEGARDLEGEDLAEEVEDLEGEDLAEEVEDLEGEEVVVKGLEEEEMEMVEDLEEVVKGLEEEEMELVEEVERDWEVLEAPAMDPKVTREMVQLRLFDKIMQQRERKIN